MTTALPVRTWLLDGTHLWGRYSIRPVGRTLWSSRTLVVFPPGTTTGERLLLRAWHVWPAVGAVVALAALVLAVSVPAVGTTTALLLYGGGFAVLARATRSLRPRVRSVTVTTFLGDGRREVHGDERLLTGSLMRCRSWSRRLGRPHPPRRLRTHLGGRGTPWSPRTRATARSGHPEARPRAARLYGSGKEYAMKHIHYDATTILVGDDVADAVIEYAAALAGGDRADTVDVPAVADDGTMTTTKILIGPSSEIVIEDAEEDELEMDNGEFVGRLRAAAKTFGHSEPIHANTRSDLADAAEAAEES